jgi:hypothetical protein
LGFPPFASERFSYELKAINVLSIAEQSDESRDIWFWLPEASYVSQSSPDSFNVHVCADRNEMVRELCKFLAGAVTQYDPGIHPAPQFTEAGREGLCAQFFWPQTGQL